MNRILKHRIVSRLKGFEQEARQLRSNIRKAASKKYDVYYLRATKEALGIDARHHLLAYAMIKGVPYKAVEPKCRDNNKPNIKLIRGTINALCGDPYYPFSGLDTWTTDKIKEWLGEEIKTEELPKIDEPKPIQKKLSLLAKVIDMLDK